MNRNTVNMMRYKICAVESMDKIPFAEKLKVELDIHDELKRIKNRARYSHRINGIHYRIN